MSAYAARRPVAAEAEFVAGDCAGHAQRCVAVVVAGTEAELHQLTQRVDLFCQQLSGAHHAQRVRAVLPLEHGDAFDHGIERLVPRHWNQRRATAPFSQHGLGGAARCRDDVVLAQAFGTELAAIDRVVRITACGHRLALARAHQHAAAHGAVAAGGLGPGVGNAGLRQVAEARVIGVRVFLLRGVDAQHPQQACAQRQVRGCLWPFGYGCVCSVVYRGGTAEERHA